MHGAMQVESNARNDDLPAHVRLTRETRFYRRFFGESGTWQDSAQDVDRAVKLPHIKTPRDALSPQYEVSSPSCSVSAIYVSHPGLLQFCMRKYISKTYVLSLDHHHHHHHHLFPISEPSLGLVSMSIHKLLVLSKERDFMFLFRVLTRGFASNST
jgi:hypothetical protein